MIALFSSNQSGIIAETSLIGRRSEGVGRAVLSPATDEAISQHEQRSTGEDADDAEGG